MPVGIEGITSNTEVSADSVVMYVIEKMAIGKKEKKSYVFNVKFTRSSHTFTYKNHKKFKERKKQVRFTMFY